MLTKFNDCSDESEAAEIKRYIPLSVLRLFKNFMKFCQSKLVIVGHVDGQTDGRRYTTISLVYDSGMKND